MPGVRVRRETTLLVVVVVLLWSAASWHTFRRDGAWLDDAFITLHAAGNVLEQGTARYFPIADNPSLLASSPLRMLILVPSLGVARLATDGPRSLQEAALAFLLAGMLTSLLAGIFFRGRPTAWLAGCTGAALLTLGTESALQMEGLLLGWLAWALLQDDPGRRPVRAGLLVGLTVLARPEFGLAAAVVVGGALLWRTRAALPRFVGALAVVGLAWIAVAMLLRVWPVPTTVLTKILSAENELFRSPPFGEIWERHVRRILLFGVRAEPLAWTLVAMVVAALAASGWRVIAGLAVWALALASLWSAPGNYPWYHENTILVLLVLAVFALVGGTRRSGWMERARVGVLVGSVGLFLLSSVGRARPWPYGFEEGPRRGWIYRDVALHHVGEGRFQFSGNEPTYLHVTEIGMIAWFAGGDVWLGDHFGLAQLENLAGAQENPACVLYPEAVLHDYVVELQAVVGRVDPAPAGVRISGIEIDPRLMLDDRCSYRSPSGLYCLVPFYEGPVEEMERGRSGLP